MDATYIIYEWLEAMQDIVDNGEDVSPRNHPTREILQKTIEIDMRRPVLTMPERKLNFRFMAAEAYWILSGDNRVDTIVPYNRNIAQFSDDGETFFGAYGPKIVGQLDYVVDKLRGDQASRQAGLTLWQENPPNTKDVPCTVGIFFNIRRGLLNCHVFMRSSDIWLGVPYDVFNFSMLSHLVCCHLNMTAYKVAPGDLHLTAVSSHLYLRNLDDAEACLEGTIVDQPPTPVELHMDRDILMGWLKDLRDTKPGHQLRWWEAQP